MNPINVLSIPEKGQVIHPEFYNKAGKSGHLTRGWNTEGKPRTAQGPQARTEPPYLCAQIHTGWFIWPFWRLLKGFRTFKIDLLCFFEKTVPKSDRTLSGNWVLKNIQKLNKKNLKYIQKKLSSIKIAHLLENYLKTNI